MNVGKTGAITPVAVLAPVHLGGSVVQRASLHNFDEIKRLDIRIGDTVLIKKAAEIIPKVIKVMDTPEHNSLPEVNPPEYCPSCHSKLVTINGEVNLYCASKNCSQQVTAQIEYWASKEAMDIDKIGPAVIQQLYDKKFISNAVDLYRLTVEDFMQLDLVQEKSATNMYNSIQASKNRPLARLLTAFSIKNVGKETADILANEFKTLDNLKNADKEAFDALPGFGEKTAAAIYDFFHDKENLKMLDTLKSLGVNPPEVKGAESDVLNGKTFVLTGTLKNMTRDEAGALIKKMGGKTSSSVSKNTSFVLAGENPGSKLDKAEKLGVIILTEDEFFDMINK